MKTISQQLKSVGLNILTPLQEKNPKKPVLVKGEWHKDWSDEDLKKSKRIGAYAKENNCYFVDIDDPSFVTHGYASCFPPTLTSANGKGIDKHLVYKLPDGAAAPKQFKYKNIIEVKGTHYARFGGDRVIKNLQRPTVVHPDEIKMHAKLAAAFAELERYWLPKGQGKRDDAWLALAGFFGRETAIPLNVKETYGARFCERTHDYEIKNRINKFSYQEKQVAKGENVHGIKELSSMLGANLPALDLLKKDAKEEEAAAPLKPYPLVDGNMLNVQEYPVPKFISYPLIRERTLNQFSGDYGSGKTHFGLSIALSIAHKQDFCFDPVKDRAAYRCEKQNPILYVEAELPAADVRDRINSITQRYIKSDYFKPEWQYTLTMEDLNIAGIDHFEDIANTSNEDAALRGRSMILDACDRIKDKHGKYPILFLDNISALTSIDENKAQDWSTMLKWLIKIKNRGITTVIFHHTGKTTGTASGSNMSLRLVDTHIVMKKADSKHRFTMSGKNVQCFVEFDKFRNFGGTDVDPMLLTCDEDGQWTKYPKLDQDCFKILKLIKEDNMKIPAVVAEMKPVTKSTVYRKIKLLEKAKLLERIENETCR